MIIPSVDIMNGRAVQLRQGRDLLLTERRDPVELAAYFNRFGPVAVVDLDAALSRGSNTEVIARCCRVASCRVGGGIRTPDDVRNWIKRGADKVVVGTMANPEFLSQFPREWLVAAVDARGTQVVDQGWTRDTARHVVAAAVELAPHCSELLFTQVEREGLLAGCDLETARLIQAAVAVPVTVAGGVRGVGDVVELVRAGFHCQIGRALYEGRLDPVEAWTALAAWNADGLVPTVVQEEATGEVLMLAWSNRESLAAALSEGVGWYWSRSRGKLWRKGETSGHTQRLSAARMDCDRDTVLFVVAQTGPACHTGRANCFGLRRREEIPHLWRTLRARRDSRPAADDRTGSPPTFTPSLPTYTQRLLADPALVAEKLREETEEVIEATEHEHIRWECADLLYHLLVRMTAAGLAPEEVWNELRGRSRA